MKEGEELVLAEPWGDLDQKWRGNRYVTPAMLDAGIGRLPELDDFFVSRTTVVLDVFSEMMHVVLATPELRSAYLELLAGSSHQPSRTAQSVVDLPRAHAPGLPP